MHRPTETVGVTLVQNDARPKTADRAAGRLEIMQRRFTDRPLLVFWEVTTACDLACLHCRANAQPAARRDELSNEEGHHLIDELSQLSSPRPILILTGGDCLKREDLLDLVDYARAASVPVALAPSVTALLTPERMRELHDHGVRTVSISLDGSDASTHDAVRGVAGHFDSTLTTVRELKDAGFSVQINTTVMARNVEQLADLAALLEDLRVDIWEVFFLISTGRGSDINASTPQQNEDISHFLVDASRYSFTVRTVEGPFFRRVRQQRAEGVSGPATSDLYDRLHTRLEELLGEPTRDVCAPSAATRDGNGIIFVGASGDVYPSGFFPLSLGNLRRTSLIDIYRVSPILRAIRDAAFHGVCGDCAYRRLCGGSRSRAYAATGDPLASDPACLLVSPPS